MWSTYRKRSEKSTSDGKQHNDYGTKHGPHLPALKVADWANYSEELSSK